MVINIAVQDCCLSMASCWHLEQNLAAATVPGLFEDTVSASHDLSEVPAAGSAMLLVAPGVIRVLSVPTSLTQN